MFYNASAKFSSCLIIIFCVIHFNKGVLGTRDNRHFSESYVSRRNQSPCGINFFKCGTGECTKEENLCDGKTDCQDGSDETRECFNILPCASKFLFQCNYGACINKTKVCDGKMDCNDNSDESEYACKNRCGREQFQCDSGQCISKNLKCDGPAECNDHSDETRKECTNMYCPPYTYRCRYGACISRSSRCDGIRDCDDSSDEEGCYDLLPMSTTRRPFAPQLPTPGSNCGAKKFTCYSGQCISAELICDGRADCIDNSDETYTLCSRLVCPAYAFRCDYGGCVSGRARCNGIKECFDNADEKYCTANERPMDIPEASLTQRPELNNDGCVIPDNPKNGRYSIGGAQNVYRPNDPVPHYSVMLTNCNQGYNTIPPDENPSICINSTWSPSPATCSRQCPQITSSSPTMECRFNNRPLKSCEDAVDGTVAIVPCQPINAQSGVVQSLVSVCRNGKWDFPATQCVSNQQGNSNGTVINVFYIINTRDSVPDEIDVRNLN